MKAYLQSIAPGTSSPRNTKLGSVRLVMDAYINALRRVGSTARVTLHGIHIYVDGKPETLGELKKRTRTINDRFDPPQQIFVGPYIAAKHKAQSFGVQQPRIVTRVNQLLGYHGRLRIHLCGQISLLPEWPLIRRQLNVLRATEDQVEVLG